MSLDESFSNPTSALFYQQLETSQDPLPPSILSQFTLRWPLLPHSLPWPGSVTLPGLVHQTQHRPPCLGTKSVSKRPEDGRRTCRLDTLKGRVPVRLPEAAPHTGGLAPAGRLLGSTLLPTPRGLSAGASIQDLPRGRGHALCHHTLASVAADAGWGPGGPI